MIWRWTVLVLLLATPATAWGGALDVQVDEREIHENEYVDLTLTVNVDHVTILAPQANADFRVEQLRIPQNMFCMTMGNEIMSGPCRFLFRLYPKRTGSLATPAARLKGDGFLRPARVLATSDSQTIRVLPGKGDKKQTRARPQRRPPRRRRRPRTMNPRTMNPRADQKTVSWQPSAPALEAETLDDLTPLAKYDVFMAPKLSRSRPFVSEPLVAEFRLYVASDSSVSTLQGARLPEPEGFRREPLEDTIVELDSETIGGRTFQVFKLGSMILIPLEPGELALAGAEARLTASTSNYQKIPGGFSFSFNSGSQPRDLVAPPVKLQVRALPEPRPQGFQAGNIGRYRITDVSLPESREAGSWVFLKYRIEGEGNLFGLAPPTLPKRPGLVVREASVDRSEVKTGTDGIRGSLEVRIPFRTDRTGTLRLGELHLVSLDPVDGNYKTSSVALPELRLVPPQGEGVAAVAAPEQTWRPVVEPDLRPGGASAPDRTWLWVLLLAILALPGLSWSGRLLAWASPRLLRRSPRRSAWRTAVQALTSLEKDREKRDDAEGFFGALAHVLHSYVQDRFGLSVAGVRLARVSEVLGSRGVSPETLEALKGELENCDFARFAPSAGEPRDRDEALRRTRDLLAALERPGGRGDG